MHDETTRDASFVSGIKDDDLVDYWVDSKPKTFGTSNSATKAAGSDSRRPKFKTSTFNNSICGLEFDGSNDCLVNAQLSKSSEKTIFIVTRRKSYVNQRRSITLAPATGNGAYAGVMVFWKL